MEKKKYEELIKTTGIKGGVDIPPLYKNIQQKIEFLKLYDHDHKTINKLLLKKRLNINEIPQKFRKDYKKTLSYLLDQDLIDDILELADLDYDQISNQISSSNHEKKIEYLKEYLKEKEEVERVTLALIGPSPHKSFFFIPSSPLLMMMIIIIIIIILLSLKIRRKRERKRREKRKRKRKRKKEEWEKEREDGEWEIEGEEGEWRFIYIQKDINST